ncbi:uncharacterized protein YjiS (DUF1127 family) [Defluviimonas denitrificans]|jgi:uncharacterized protein YjiS (DUF1127 family)|uniref:Uncharacterized protein YjiS (DUF1127 family) n=1 Tax=Albidovulum denitrificans TaxID=404881 RepID=A0A2S8S2V3_9RHOB|nr:DUF1127 domain-containing protein [Defluviimonas denitrificans]PQV55146.1 uncharacterized protein YjiS (DUF1127 family) [Defluviimonas denitrificans]
MPPDMFAPARSPSLKRRLIARLRLWQARRRSRIALSRLDARLLRDCGLSERDVRQEVGRPFWNG